MIFSKTHSSFPFYVAVFSVAMILVFSGLLRQGMFMDGIQYACVSKNLAEGHGSFWFPFLSPFWVQNGAFHFFEHPPLFYFFESLFFKIPGIRHHAENVFCGITWIFNAFMIHAIWKLMYKTQKEKQLFSWLPILLWTVTPVCFWCFENNMIEVLVSVFVLIAVYCMLRFLLQTQKNYAWLVLTGALLYAGFLTKGLIGLFPLSIPLIFSITHKTQSLKQALVYTFIVLGSFTVVFCLVWFSVPSAQYSLGFYLKERLVNRIAQTPTVSNRFELLFDLVSQLLPVLIITGLVFGIQKTKKKLPPEKEGMNWFWFFLLLACCGSLPIMLTMVQKGFYFMPSLSFFALAFSVLILGFFKDITIRINSMFYKCFKVLSMLMIAGSVVFCIFSTGKFNRDENILKEVQEVGNLLEQEKIINVDMDVYCTWNYQFYLQRYHGLYLDPTKTYRKYLLVKEPSKTSTLDRYAFVKEFSSGFKLYEKK